jgi:multicomponent Na+:H+ antiporter subunit B
MAGVVYAGQFCENVFANFGNIGDLISTGTIFYMNSAVGLKVLTGIGVLILTMLSALMLDDEKEGE